MMQALISIIYTTMPSEEEAELLARQAIDLQLAGCVNIIPHMTSFYRWNGSTEKSCEVVMIFKTTNACHEACMAWIKSRHPYETPAIFSSNAHTLPDFYAYIQKNTMI